MWLERFNIVVISLERPHLPSAWGSYAPTIWDWGIFGGTIGLFLTGLLLAVRVVQSSRCSRCGNCCPQKDRQ